MKPLIICGPGRSGKDLMCEFLAGEYGMKFSGSTSRIICPHAARELGISEEEAFETRHAHRMLWRRIGDELRADDAAFIAKSLAASGNDVIAGIRARVEIVATIREGIGSHVIWIDRDVPVDPTLEYGPEVADVRLDNNGDVMDFFHRIRLFMYSIGVYPIWSNRFVPFKER